MHYEVEEILEAIQMTSLQNLDVRTVTLGISLLDISASGKKSFINAVTDRIRYRANDLVKVSTQVSGKYGVSIVNKRVSLTPLSLVASPLQNEDDFVLLAKEVDKAAGDIGVDFIGGYSALVHKAMTGRERIFIKSIPAALAATSRLCSSVNVASTRAGINMDAVQLMGKTVRDTAQMTADSAGAGCARLVVFCNIPDDNPFMAGAIHGTGEGEAALNVGISGPGVVHHVVQNLANDADMGTLAEEIKKTVFKITRMGELMGREVAGALGVPFGILDLSLAPTPAIGDSVADIIEAMGIERCGGHGTTAALAMLNDAVKKGGVFASSYVGGLSGAFIPVSEDSTMARRAQSEDITIDKLEAMTSVCSVGLDMIAIPGDTPADVISAIIADEVSIGVCNNKTTAVRVIPVPGAVKGDNVAFGGLLGSATVMEAHVSSPSIFIRRGGRIPAPLQSLRN